MSLSPVYTPAEQLLLQGPRPLARYAGESFAWLHAMRRGPIDWNTLLSLDIDYQRLRRIAWFFINQLPLAAPDAPDPHHAVRVSALFLEDLASVISHAATLRETAAKTQAYAALAADLARADLPVEQRARQEWTAWFAALEAFVEQETRVVARVEARLKRSAAEAELAPPDRPAPVPEDID